MSMRAILISIICLILLRFSGRRAFGMHAPLDNVIAILLGAILARAVVGASPLLGTITAATTIAILHRIAAWIGIYSQFFGRIVKGEAKVLYENGKLNIHNMRYCRITKKDLTEGIRLQANVNSFENIEAIYAERNGKISVVLKKILKKD